MKSNQMAGSGQASPSPFVQMADGLVAQNEQVRLLISPVHRAGDVLIEDTECHVLVQALSDGRVELFIDGDPASGFLRDGRLLWGRLHTGDRPGRRRFDVRVDGRGVLCADLDVRPAKLDCDADYETMRADIERICRSLFYMLPHQGRTAMHLCPTEGTALDFVQIAERLLDPLLSALRAVSKCPDQRLVAQTSVRPVALATGRDPDALAHLARTPSAWVRQAGKPVPARVRETHRHPAQDTLTNRVLAARLQRLCRRAGALVRVHSPIQAVFENLLRCLQWPVFQQVSGVQSADVLPLFLPPHYRHAFALVRALDDALAPCAGGPFDLSVRDTPMLYEYWTWFTLVQMFCDLGFSPDADTGLFRLTDRGLLISPAQGEASAIHFQKDRQRVRLMYNPTYAAASGRALTHDLRPDMVVEVLTPERSVHVFDAKYRREDAGGYWVPLRDDIDKMHAYRDAIGQVLPTGFERTLQSAIVLFPAPHDPAYRDHPFCKSLPHGIGGLPMLPGNAETLGMLRDYLSDLMQ